MRRTVISLVLTGILLAGLSPLVAIAEERSELKGLLARLQQELGRLQRPELNALLARLQEEAERALEAPEAPIVAAPIIVPPGFSSSTSFSGLTDPRGFDRIPFGPPLPPIFPGFPCCDFFVEQSLNRVSRFDSPTKTFVPFATGLSTPTDLLFPPGFGSGPFGNFLYVTESGANRISRISATGAVTTFSSFTSAPKRMAFSPVPDFAFGTLLFVTLADGRLVKVDPTGVVSPCASGLSGPEGLEFGPGGLAFKNVLFVVESTGNMISKVSPACTVSPFATTGLSAPVTLAISPGGAWGTIDTLYVVNATTRVDRVDKNGNVTAFASGFTKMDTVRLSLEPLFSLRPDRLGVFFPMRISDAGAGTIEHVSVNFGFLLPQRAGCDPCRAGDTFAVDLTVENRSPIALPVEIKAGFLLLDGTPVNFAPLLGHNKHFEAVLPPGFRFQGRFLTLTMPPVTPGRYCYEVDYRDSELFSGFFPAIGGRVCFTVLP